MSACRAASASSVTPALRPSTRSLAAGSRRHSARSRPDGRRRSVALWILGELEPPCDTPLIVISAARHRERFRGAPPRLFRLAVRFWLELQVELAGLSSDRVHVVALRSDHFVQRAGEQPDVVVAAVEAMVRAVRDGAELPPCSRLSTGPDVRCLRWRDSASARSRAPERKRAPRLRAGALGV